MPQKLLLALCFTLLLSGCRQSKPASDATAAPSGPVKTYPIRAKIVSVKAASVLLDHEAIPGFMEAMTMTYKLKDPSIVSELHPGDRITGTLLVSKDADGFNTVLLDNIVVIAQAKPDYKPAIQYHVPQAGDAVPDFKLVNQNARTLQLSQFHGKVLLVTFIYTRCPLAEFCPRMSQNFVEVDKALSADPALYAHTHLLSISFDPTYDTPKVLRAYGESYTQQHGSKAFQHWDFAAPQQADLAALTQFFNVGITPGESKTLNHSLSTVLIGKDGKIVAWYPNNEWTPADVVTQIRQSAA